ncbi:short-subunit dehydrogenase [Anoxybacillus vitaminiphilus]|uniref:Short-subunit dehydrogenase n=1 Tax=Paranoxybacillus vitaminiphilus TaxID=581036 RepID=A0A327Y2X5_9BACL|nr:SDR family NAD(P)-dependent oxidoreductase [Anoxybacillus vitaminiphilus]RAK15558.1 short-subunit dehydrogenase [Anoxybacillus vitaminiphilus]
METIVITGAGTGLGKELALEYAEQGNTIILTGRRLDPLLAVQQEIEQRGGNAFSYTIDIRNYENVKATVAEILKHHQVTCLINNAGVGYFGPFTSLTAEQIHDMIETNVKGTIFMTKAFLLYFHTIPKAKILNIISTAGLRGKVNESVYVASKFAVRGFSESLVKELEHTNISVTAVYMGGMDTPFWEGTDHIKDRTRLRSAKEVARQIIAEDNGQPEIIIQC